MSRPARFTLKEVQTLVKAAQKANSRLILELERDGKMRIVLNDGSEPLEPDHEVVM